MAEKPKTPLLSELPIGEGNPTTTSVNNNSGLGTFNPLGTNGKGLSPVPPMRLQRSSPGSEALVSSDDEADMHPTSYFNQRNGSLAAGNALASRRPSYAAEFQNRQRNYSITGGSTLSPTTSGPTTPSGDTSLWASNLGGSSVWLGGSTSIWGDSNRKSPPKSLTLQGGNIGPSAPSPLFVGSEALPSPTTTTIGMNHEIPLQIPLQPQIRNYRSMSYSAGQGDDMEDRTRQRSPTMLAGGRQFPALQHRPSRPSLLSTSEQLDTQPPLLRNISEQDDDSSIQKYSEPAPNTYLQQASSHALLGARRNTVFESFKFRNRSASMTTSGFGSGMLGGGRDGERIEDEAIEDDDGLDSLYPRRVAAGRSMSVMYPGANPLIGNFTRRQQFGSFDMDGLQSRRHSFNVASTMNENAEDYNLAVDARTASPPSFNQQASLGMSNNSPLNPLANSVQTGMNHEKYFQNEMRLRPRQSFDSRTTMLQQAQQAAYANNRSMHHPQGGALPLRGMPGVPHHAPRGQQVLYMVSFKACRTDVFYVQEGTGLRIKVGDLVIVEADRGTDLGTVVAENVSWQQAKEYKEFYQQEHYKWLMVFARQNAPAPPAMNVVPPPPNGIAANGQFPQGLQGATAGSDAANALELKPKMIKRLAQTHEIQTLREKEANEAKAKRLCQQKVIEHRLPMEILDAEFQMDWKKLTFYYFADSYINFNSLVTDLFKVYKTRIWMSAMNPAAFAHTQPDQPGGDNGQHTFSSQQQFGGGMVSASGMYGQLPAANRPNIQQQPPTLRFDHTNQPPLAPHENFNHLQQQQVNGYNPNLQQRPPTGNDQWVADMARLNIQ